MPKGWIRHRAEIERLYIQQGRPLNEVRDILRLQHKFHASTRAYSVKIDEWGLRKYKVNKTDSSPPRPLQTFPTPLPQTPLQVNPLRPPASPDSVEATENLSLIEHLKPPYLPPNTPIVQGPFGLGYAFQALLKRWKPGPESVSGFLKRLEFDDWLHFSAPDHGPLLFRLIEALVPEEEQFTLTKVFLEEDLTSQSNDDYPYIEWRDAWSALCDAEEWEDAKELLCEDSVISQVAGATFFNCALVVAAERQLCRCRTQINHFQQIKAQPDDLELFCAKKKWMIYMEILEDFRHTDYDVTPSFYEYALQIIELDEFKDVAQSARTRLELADEYRQKCLKISSQHLVEDNNADDVMGTSGDGLSASCVEAAQKASSSSFTVMGPPVPPSSGSREPTLQKNSIPDAHEVLQILWSKWRSLNGFKNYAHSIITEDGSNIYIFEPAPIGHENLFSIIQMDIPPNEQVSFVKALLVAFSSVPLSPQFSPWSLVSWNSLYTSSSWDKFQIRLNAKMAVPQLERIMSPAAAKLFLDSTIVLVGERLLVGIKAQMVAVRRKKPPDRDSALYDRLLQQYFAIIKEFQRRDMKVDQSWMSYLLNIM